MCILHLTRGAAGMIYDILLAPVCGTQFFLFCLFVCYISLRLTRAAEEISKYVYRFFLSWNTYLIIYLFQIFQNYNGALH